MNVVPAVLAKPKSRIFKVQSDLTTILLGFKSWKKELKYLKNISSYKYIYKLLDKLNLNA